MKKFDEILDKIFHSKLGLGILTATAVAGAMAMTGCIVTDSLSCMCEEMGCSDVGECWNCLDDCFSCQSSCDFLNCVCGDGCTKDCGSKGVIECGGCNRTCFTDCGASCGDVKQFGNCTCSPSTDTISITVQYCLDGYVVSEKSSSEARYENKEYVEIGSWAYKNYFNIEGFYSSDGTKVLDSTGKVVNQKALQVSSITLTAKMTEKRAGDNIIINFDTSAYPGLIINPMRAIVGRVIDDFRQPTLDGYTFKGWKVVGGDSDKIINIEIGETVCHLYTFGADVNAEKIEITLRPVFTQNTSTGNTSNGGITGTIIG